MIDARHLSHALARFAGRDTPDHRASKLTRAVRGRAFGPELSMPLAQAKLRSFVTEVAALLRRTRDEPEILAAGGRLLADLVARDDWLPEAYAQPDPERYRQYLLHCDSAEAFSLVSFVWGPGQATPVHDHTVWGLVGVLRGAELAQGYERTDQGLRPKGEPHRLEAGQVEAVSPCIGDIHRVANAFDDRVSISIHLYGANIGAVRRATYNAEGRPKPFVSGYANAFLPNLWDASSTRS